MIGRTNATVGMAYEPPVNIMPYLNAGGETIDTAALNPVGETDIKLALPNYVRGRLINTCSTIKSIDVTFSDKWTGSNYTLYNNPALETLIIRGDVSKCTSSGWGGLCWLCYELKNVMLPENGVKSSCNGFRNSTKLTLDSLANILTSLYDFRSAGDTTTTCTLTLHATTKATLTPEQIATANAKGWTIA